MTRLPVTVLLLLGAIAGLEPATVLAQTEPPAQSEAPAPKPPDKPQPEPAQTVVYKPPLRGAPGGRVGGASRSAIRTATPLPMVEPLAPADHAGVTAHPSPTLYYYASGAVSWPTQFTISAPLQPAPVIEVTIPSPPGRGLYPLRLSDYGVRLRPGVDYTWSVSVIINPHAWSRNIVGSAAILFDPAAEPSATAAAQPLQRAAILASGGVWYDAVAAAVEGQPADRGVALADLIRQAGLAETITPPPR